MIASTVRMGLYWNKVFDDNDEDYGNELFL